MWLIVASIWTFFQPLADKLCHGFAIDVSHLHHTGRKSSRARTTENTKNSIRREAWLQKYIALITIKNCFNWKPAGAVFYPSCTWVKLIPAWKRISNTKKYISESPWWNEKLDGTKNDIKTPPRSPIWRKSIIVDLLGRVSSFKLSPIRANVLPTSLTLCLSRSRDWERWQFSPEFFRASIILSLLLCQLLSTLSCRNFQNLILAAANKGIFKWTCSVSEGS